VEISLEIFPTGPYLHGPVIGAEGSQPRFAVTLERAIQYIDIDESVEATPKSLRLRKRILGATAHKRAAVAA
jgi:predicted membrane GTPase involved in stress response